MNAVKAVAVIFIALVILNFALFVFNKISGKTFWIVVIMCALAAYIIPKLGGVNK